MLRVPRVLLVLRDPKVFKELWVQLVQKVLMERKGLKVLRGRLVLRELKVL